MTYTIKNFELTGNFDIQAENQQIINNERLRQNTILIDISEEISTITLIIDYISKGICKNSLYQFRIYNNKLNKEINLGGEFILKLKQP